MRRRERGGFKFLTSKGFEESLLTQLTNFESKFGKDEFFYTHWLDVVLYGTMYFGEKIRLDFIDQFEKLRKKHNHKHIHIVSHSLGTAVAHDALAKFYRIESDPFDDIPDLKAGDFNIGSLWTFANVSRMVNILNDLTDPYSSTVVTGNEGCTNRLLNVRHKYDPFTWFKTYDRNMTPKETLRLTTIRNPDTHDFYEYVTEPRASRAILNIVYAKSVSDAQFEKGQTEYKKGALTSDVKELRDLVNGARESTSIDSIKKAVNKFKQIRTKIEKLEKKIAPQP